LLRYLVINEQKLFYCVLKLSNLEVDVYRVLSKGHGNHVQSYNVINGDGMCRGIGHKGINLESNDAELSEDLPLISFTLTASKS